MARIKLHVNGRTHAVDVDPETPLLWVLRDHLGLRGAKYGCGVGQCGACTVHVDDDAVRSCIVSAGAARGSKIVTIEGIVTRVSRALQDAWVAESVPQCGYCQTGQLMHAAAFLASEPNPSGEAITAAMSDNLCRCGTYGRIRRAIKRAARDDRVRE